MLGLAKMKKLDSSKIQTKEKTRSGDKVQILIRNNTETKEWRKREREREKKIPEGSELVVVELEAHAVMDLVVFEGDMVLVDVVPFLDPDLVSSRPRLRRHQLLQVSDRVVVVALHPDFLPQSIVQHHLNHFYSQTLELGILSPYYSKF